MKKVLSTVAALGLVAGFAATASAVDLKLSGSYQAEGYWYDHGDGDGVALTKTNPEATGDDYILHSFYVKPVLVVNDKVKMVTDLWMADRTIWGNQAGGDIPSAANSDGGEILVHKMFLQYMSPVGQIRVGRHLANPFGTSFLDSERHQDRIMWWPSFLAKGGFKTLLFTAKVTENDGVNPVADQDVDYYEARIYHKSSAGQLIAGLSTTLNKGNATMSYTKNRFKVSGAYNFGNMYLQSELHYDFGEMDRDTGTDVDLSTIAFMADVGVKTGQMDVGGMFVFATGDDNGYAGDGTGSTDDERSDAMISGQGNGLGENFQPLYILTGETTGLFNPYVNGLDGDAARAGLMMLAAHFDYQINSQLNLHSAVAYALAESEPTGWDDDYGLELNVGMGYKLLDNLSYAVHLGYLITGDFFKRGVAGADVEDVILASHHLTMEF